MKALSAYYDRTGPAREVIGTGELPVAPPGPGEVLVRLRVSGVNPTDVKARGAAPGRKKAFDRIVPHQDGAGDVEAVGEGVPSSCVGGRVWVFGAQRSRPFGTASQYLTIPADRVVRLPTSQSYEAGACVGVPVMTAYNAVMGDGPVAGRTVLITGGAGAVGHYAVQIARLHGATVIATVSSPEKARHAIDGGAHHAVDYRTGDPAAQIFDLTGGHGIDHLVDVDTTGNARLIADVMAMGGRAVSYGSSGLTSDIPIRDLRQKCVSMRFLNILQTGPETLSEIAAAVHGLLEATSCATGSRHASRFRRPPRPTRRSKAGRSSRQGARGNSLRANSRSGRVLNPFRSRWRRLRRAGRLRRQTTRADRTGPLRCSLRA